MLGRPLARHVGRLSRADAEDIAAKIFAWLLAHRVHLATPPSHAYVLRAARYGALRWHAYGWRKHVVAMDPEVLQVVEQMSYDPTSPRERVPR